jgi:hypothetical protein
MPDVAYRCHHCGSVHEAESIRENLYLDQRPISSYAPTSVVGLRLLGRLLLRWRISSAVAKALWPRLR